MKRILIAIQILIIPASAALAQNHKPAVSEYELKAAFVFNFAKFVQWPDTALGPEEEALIIGVLGEDPFGGYLDAVVAGNHLKNRPIQIKRFKRLDQLERCHLLYISASESSRLGRVMQRVGKESILTVGETQDFLRVGGIIRLLSRGNKVRFEINQEASKKVGLRISSRLLRLAENLKPGYSNGKN